MIPHVVALDPLILLGAGVAIGLWLVAVLVVLPAVRRRAGGRRP